jgi:NAD(P)-dependent dehydrogenase (short-subunit alcohol dehydrogenase family)
MNDFEGKVVLVTGASSGIGRATAVMAAERGAFVVLAARRSSDMEDAVKAVPPGRKLVVNADLTKEIARTNLVGAAIEKFGGIDVLVNAAGIIGNGTIENTTPDEWDRMLDINLRSMFRLTQLALPSIIERKGNIVNLSSVTGTRAFPGVLAYCVSKAGVDQFTRCLALELGAKGVRVNAVNPGVVVTNTPDRQGGAAGGDRGAYFIPGVGAVRLDHRHHHQHRRGPGADLRSVIPPAFEDNRKTSQDIS